MTVVMSMQYSGDLVIIFLYNYGSYCPC